MSDDELVLDDDDPANHFFVLANIFAQSPGLSPQAYRLYTLLRSYCMKGNPTCFPGHAGLAKSMSVTRRTIITIQQELIEKGCLCVEQRPGHSNLYRVIAPHKHPHVLAYNQEHHGTLTDEGCETHFTPPTTGCETHFTPRCEASFTGGVKPTSHEEYPEKKTQLKKTHLLSEIIEPREDQAVAADILTVFEVTFTKQHLATAQGKALRLQALGLDPVDVARDCRRHHELKGTKVLDWLGRYEWFIRNEEKSGGKKSVDIRTRGREDEEIARAMERRKRERRATS